jgi:hypothetical protein
MIGTYRRSGRPTAGRRSAFLKRMTDNSNVAGSGLFLAPDSFARARKLMIRPSRTTGTSHFGTGPPNHAFQLPHTRTPQQVRPARRRRRCQARRTRGTDRDQSVHIHRSTCGTAYPDTSPCCRRVRFGRRRQNQAHMGGAQPQQASGLDGWARRNRTESGANVAALSPFRSGCLRQSKVRPPPEFGACALR